MSSRDATTPKHANQVAVCSKESTEYVNPGQFIIANLVIVETIYVAYVSYDSCSVPLSFCHFIALWPRLLHFEFYDARFPLLFVSYAYVTREGRNV